MTPRMTLAALCTALLTTAGCALAQQHDPATPIAVASKVALRGRTVFYRFKWLDNVGNQVGDGESWKQLGVLGLGQQTIKSVAPGGAATDFQIEMNVETR